MSPAEIRTTQSICSTEVTCGHVVILSAASSIHGLKLGPQCGDVELWWRPGGVSGEVSHCGDTLAQLRVQSVRVDGYDKKYSPDLGSLWLPVKPCDLFLLP